MKEKKIDFENKYNIKIDQLDFITVQSVSYKANNNKKSYSSSTNSALTNEIVAGKFLILIMIYQDHIRRALQTKVADKMGFIW